MPNSDILTHTSIVKDIKAYSKRDKHIITKKKLLTSCIVCLLIDRAFRESVYHFPKNDLTSPYLAATAVAYTTTDHTRQADIKKNMQIYCNKTNFLFF